MPKRVTNSGVHPVNLTLPQPLWEQAAALADVHTGGSLNAYVVRAVKTQVMADTWGAAPSKDSKGVG